MVDGVEAAPQSRRVVFNFDVSQDRLIEDLGRELKSAPSAAAEAGGGALGLPAPIEGLQVGHRR
jgi:hypothetical protein